ncbi:metal-sensitive transcriptional regulator [Bacillus cereus]
MEYNQDMKNRLKRIEGQVRGVLRMMEEGKDCREVITQLTASRSALDRTIGLVVGTNLEQCLREQFESGNGSNEELIKEAVQLLVKADNLSNVSIDRFSKTF